MPPIIEHGLYSDERQKQLQDMLTENYRAVEPLADGRYSPTLGVEAAQLNEGFAYLEDNVEKGEKLSLDYLLKALGDVQANVRFCQPIPERFLTDENKSADCFALYIRYKVPKESKPAKTRLLIKKEAAKV